MKRGILLFMVAIASSQASAATSVLWQTIYAKFTYRDYGFNCSAGSMGHYFTYLVAEVKDGKVERATLRQEYTTGRYRSQALDAATVAGMTVKTDATDRVWLEKLPLNAAAIHWLMKYSDFHCDVAARLKTITPHGYPFEFKVQKAETLDSLYTPPVRFTGETTAGKPFEIDFVLVQQPKSPY